MGRERLDHATRVLLVGLITASGGCGDAGTPRSGPRVNAEPPSLRLLVDGPGSVGSPRVSPTGSYLAFDGWVGGSSRILVMDLETSEVRTVTSGSGNDRRPAWSATGDSLAFLSDRGGSQGIWISDVAGSAPRRVFDASGSSMSALDWSPDGSRIAFSRLDPSRPGNVSYGRSTILTVEAASGDTLELTTRGDEWWPTWSADGEWLYYYVGKTDDIEAVHGTTGEVRSAGGGGLVGWRPSASPEGGELAYVSDIGGIGVFTASLTGDGAPTARLLTGNADVPSYLPDGSGLVLTMDTTSTQVATVDLASGTRQVLGTALRSPEALPDRRIASLPQSPRGNVVLIHEGNATDTLRLPVDHVSDIDFSPDGRRLVVMFPTPGDARYDLHLLTADGEYIRQLTHSGDVFTALWCDDSATVVFSSASDKTSNTLRRVRAVDVRTGNIDQLDVELAANQWPTHCDRAATRVTFELRLNGSGQFTVNRTDGTLTHLGAGRRGRWSPDGERFAFLATRDGTTDVFVREADGTESQVTRDEVIESEVGWSTDGAALLITYRQPRRGIWLLEF